MQVAALAHDPQAMQEAREAVAEADELLAVAKQQVAALQAETKPLEQVCALDATTRLGLLPTQPLASSTHPVLPRDVDPRNGLPMHHRAQMPHSGQ